MGRLLPNTPTQAHRCLIKTRQTSAQATKNVPGVLMEGHALEHPLDPDHGHPLSVLHADCFWTLVTAKSSACTRHRHDAAINGPVHASTGRPRRGATRSLRAQKRKPRGHAAASSAGSTCLPSQLCGCTGLWVLLHAHTCAHDGGCFVC